MRILCIDDRIRPGELEGQMPTIGEEYTVTKAYVSYFTDPKGYLCYMLLELRPVHPYYGVCGFRADLFIKAEDSTDKIEENEHTRLEPVAMQM